MKGCTPQKTGEKNKPELLAPAGNRERLCAAVQYGADAVYLGGYSFGMRASPANFSAEELKEAVAFAHAHGVRVYLTCNTLPRNGQFAALPAFLQNAAHAGVDAYIVTDLGVLRVLRQVLPGAEIHISTQAGIVNYESALFFYELGAKRAVLARELTLDEIAEIRRRVPEDMELEAFVHGAMCVSFSGRCLLSAYLTGRDANQGDCAQPCRWRYLLEEPQSGRRMLLKEEPEGTYLYNAEDLCMLGHLREMMEAGVSSLKMEGRAKSAYYVATVTNAYRLALDAALEEPPRLPAPWVFDEVEKISHRAYSQGFYLGGQPGQTQQSGGYIQEYEAAAVVEGYSRGRLLLSQRNRFFTGQSLEVLEPGKEPFSLSIEEMFNGEGEPIASAPHPGMRVLLPFGRPLEKGSYLRRKREQTSGG